MTAVFVIATLVFLVARSKEREARRLSRTKRVRYYLLVSFLDFLKMFLLVMVLYHGLLLFVEYRSDGISTGDLVNLENFLSRVESYCKALKLTSPVTLLLLVGLYAAGQARFVRVLDQYKKITKRIYQFVALLCCFTLLGSQAGEPAMTLSIQIKRNRREYGVLRDSIRKALRDRIASKLADRVANSFPPPYAHDLGSAPKFDDEIKSLQGEYQEIKQNNGESKELRAFLTRHHPVTDVETPDSMAEGNDIKPEEISGASYKEIKNSEAVVGRLGQAAPPDKSGLDAAKKLTVEIFKSLKEKAMKSLLDSYIKELPILGPVRDVFSNALDKAVQEFIDKKADAIASTIPKDSKALETSLSDRAESISESIRIETNSHILANERRDVLEWQLEVRQITILKVRAPIEVENAKVHAGDALIAMLGSPNAGERETAVERIAAMRGRITRRQLERIRDLMRRGNRTWRKRASREGHCTWYEYTSIRYYAGEALEKIGPPYANDETIREARRAEQDGKTMRKVTDPGWI
jgi:hypothetical protein